MFLCIYTANRLAEAATKVAEVLGGDTKKTEEELLELYLYGEKKPSSEAGKPKESLKYGWFKRFFS